ncbi:DUF4870 domain-containing protein [Proteiniborus sp. MB09-C3]|uniref:DUF4870 domain-containing protein n=1 Tax=Proteiniborus sp. MB09-C3 TaxID=3050072 RepID=UPI002552C7CF|nr:DUF4870 domain-containing protein [Proteiniborus sp. MB09-C3]WIV12328.1 DUF4870 domain-containing protein [Proteiniborus sp. MB09-C3]
MDNDNKASDKEKSSLGMEENIAALLSYVLGFITGIIFYVLEKDSKFVKFHAMQSIIYSIGLMVLSFILGFIPIVGWIISLIIGPLSLILWIILMIKAYKYEYFKLPIIGDMAEKQAN